MSVYDDLDEVLSRVYWRGKPEELRVEFSTYRRNFGKQGRFFGCEIYETEENHQVLGVESAEGFEAAAQMAIDMINPGWAADFGFSLGLKGET